MAVQQVVGRRQRHLAAQTDIQRLLDLADNQDTADLSLLEEWRQKGRFLVVRHVLVPSPTFLRKTTAKNAARAHKASAQLASPTGRKPYNSGCRLQR